MYGQLLSAKVREGRAREDGNGRWPDRFQLTLLTGDRTVSVEYRDEDAAIAAVRASGFMGELSGALNTHLALPVGVRSVYQGRPFLYGRRAE